MGPVLATIVVLVTIFVAAIVGTFFWLREFLRAKIAYHWAAGIHRFPQRLTFRPLEPFIWRKPTRGQQRVDLFRALGFEELGGFAVDEIPAVRCFAVQHPVTRLIGVVNEHEQLGTWADVMLFQPGQRQPILASGILKHLHFFWLPGSPKIHKHKATEQELATAVSQSAGPGAPALKVNRAEFARLYEEAFADATDSRLLESLSDSEVRRLVRAQTQPCGEGTFTDADFERTKQQYPLAINNELRLACGSQFIRETVLPASQWQDARQRLLVIHDRTPLRELTKRRIYGAFLTETLERLLKRIRDSSSPRESFAKFNETLPTWDRYKKLGQVSRPVAADIYSAPISRRTA
jgi:hypothetical protein